MEEKLNRFLEAISENRPTGEDLSFSAEFDRIQEARREDDPTMDYGEWQVSLKQADWNEVVSSCTQLLQTRSKDLRLVGWLTEGWVKTSGLSGLSDGIELAARLIECFGAGIYPMAEGDDHEQRIGTLSWFIARMSQLTRQVPITRSVCGQFSLNDYDSARYLQTQLQRNAEKAGNTEDKLTLEKILKATEKTDKKLYSQWINDAERALLMLEKLIKASEKLFGSEGPSFSPLAKSLDAILDRLRSIANDLGIQTAGMPVEPQSISVMGQPAQEGAPLIHGPILTRAHALELLRQVALYFRNTEPHSPVAYLADKAAHWGTMPLHSWLRAVVKDQGTLSHFEELLGLDMEAEKAHSND
ncbi:MAG TPA: type VI secretion system protein TssA [Noviherbaspirillum sp.]|nr:type VI secretion system protein TssA [Noviherbaspirillum sp.]